MGLLKMKIHQLETSEEGRFGIGQDSWGGGLAWDQGIKALFHKTWKDRGSCRCGYVAV